MSLLKFQVSAVHIITKTVVWVITNHKGIYNFLSEMFACRCNIIKKNIFRYIIKQKYFQIYN